VIGLAGVACAPSVAIADVVLDTTYGTSYDATWYNNSAGNGNSAQRDITSFGTGADRTISGGGNSATVGYDVSGTGFKVDFSQGRTGTQYSYAGSEGILYFAANDATTTYTLAGSYTFSSPYADLTVQLYDYTANQYVVDQHLTYNNSGLPGSTFTVGGTEGQYDNTYGALGLSGTLLLGHHYQLYTRGVIEAYPNPDQGATASGWLSLSFSDIASEASPTPIPAAAPAGLALMGALGLRRRSRRTVAGE
jgi:hypothetical protein